MKDRSFNIVLFLLYPNVTFSKQIFPSKSLMLVLPYVSFGYLFSSHKSKILSTANSYSFKQLLKPEKLSIKVKIFP